jgi:hypothetical protein
VKAPGEVFMHVCTCRHCIAYRLAPTSESKDAQPTCHTCTCHTSPDGVLRGRRPLSNMYNTLHHRTCCWVSKRLTLRTRHKSLAHSHNQSMPHNEMTQMAARACSRTPVLFVQACCCNAGQQNYPLQRTHCCTVRCLQQQHAASCAAKTETGTKY